MSTQKKINLIGYIDVPLERIDAITAALPEHIRLTRLEAGCIRFDVTADSEHKGRFHVAEVFANRADFDAHQDRTQTSDWARITQGIARHYSLSEID